MNARLRHFDARRAAAQGRPDEWPFYSVESDGGEPSSPAPTKRGQPRNPTPMQPKMDIARRSRRPFAQRAASA
jgi:hypothetical protein